MSRCTLDPAAHAHPSAYGAFTLCGRLSQNRSASRVHLLVRSEPHGARAVVWALPVSLAATPGIDVSFSSSGYLDVSVRRVPLHALWIRAWMHGILPMRVSPFRHLRITGHLPLPAAFRSLSRLSSALSAKASALRPFLLGLSCCIALQRSCSLLPACFPACMPASFLLVCFSDVDMLDIFFLGKISLSHLASVWSFQGTCGTASARPLRLFLPAARIPGSSLPDALAAGTRLPHGFPWPFLFYAGSHLLSHAVSSTVSSAAHVLTAVFGMFYGCAPRAHRRQLSFHCFTKAAQQWNNPYF